MSAVIRPQHGLRPMTDDDLYDVFDIERATYKFPWTLGIFRDCLHVGYSCWVHETDGVIDAYAVMSIAAGEAHILTIVVKKDSRGQGVGALMLTHLLNLARRHKADHAILEVRPSNDVAIHLYRKQGFKQIGTRTGYYPGVEGREDAIVMSLQLSTAPPLKSI